MSGTAKAILTSIFALFVYILFSTITTAHADVINPGFYEKSCEPHELEVECSYSKTTIDGNLTHNACARYASNPNFRLLTGTESTFGGSSRYCLMAESSLDIVLYHVKTWTPIFAITLMIEALVLIAFRLTKRKHVAAFLAANFVSFTLLYIATLKVSYIYFSDIFLELLVIGFELAFLKFFIKDVPLKKVLAFVFVANLVSFLAGGYLIRLMGY